MKIKQLEALKSQHAQYQNHGLSKKPEEHSRDEKIRVAIINGEQLRLKPREHILAAARAVIANNDRYEGKKIRFQDIFDAPTSDDSALKQWEKAEAERQKRLTAYNKVAEKIIRKAELDENADAQELGAQLYEAAAEHGLAN
jgi:hypothetical protein